MKKRIKNTYLIILCIIFIMFIFNTIVNANQNEKEKIYIAGNENLGKIEKYNAKTKKYEGLIPNFFEELEKKSDFDFEYIQKNRNKQKTIQNKQADIVSVITDKEEPYIKEKIEIFELEDGTKIYIGFSEIISENSKNEIKEAIEHINQKEREHIILKTFKEENETNNKYDKQKNKWIIISSILIMLVIYWYIQILKNKIKNEKFIDKITNRSNYTNFRETFNKFISNEVKSQYCLIDIGINISNIEKIYGNEEVNDVLKKISDVLNEYIDEQEMFCRKGIDSFIVLMKYGSKNSLEERIIVINQRIINETKKHIIDCKYGIYLLKSIDNLEKAEYYAKKIRRSIQKTKELYSIANSKMLKEFEREKSLFKEMEKSFQNNEFIAYAQPIIDTRKNNIYGIEILARWENENEGFVKPKEFLNMIKINNLEYELDIQMFKKSCEYISKSNEKMRVFCNFSRSNIVNNNFIEDIKNIVLDFSVDTSKIIIVITQNIDNGSVKNNVAKLKKLGFLILFEDFGGNLNSLSDVLENNCDYIKLSENLIEMLSDERSKRILVRLINIFKEFGIEVICNNINNQETANMLNQLNCNLLQGNLYYQAMPLEEIIKLNNTIKF